MRMLSLESWSAALTLGTRELALLLTRLNGTVDVGLKGLVGKVVDLVVGLDVLLDSLTAVGRSQRELLCASGRKHDAMHQQRQLRVGD